MNKLAEHKVYMELTNPVHGGEGWDLGDVLWSPATSSWKIMEDINPGDIIIHSVKNKKPHEIIGVSKVKKSAIVLNYEPITPGKWGGYKSYYRIELQDFSTFLRSLPQKDFFVKYYKELRELGKQKSFYAIATKGTDIKTAEKYIANVPQGVLNLIDEWFTLNNINPFDNVAVSDKEDNCLPGRTTTTTERIIRDTSLIKELKGEYKNICQVCGKSIKLPNGKQYSEGHHLKKLGGLHQGPDTKDNIIILCPYHHTEFDYGCIAINPSTKLLKHIDIDNEFNNKPLAYQRDDLSITYLKYHYDNLFNK